MVYFGKCCASCLLKFVFIFPIQAGASCIWANDSHRFLLENFDAIHDSPSYLYHSALPFSPSSSWLHECYSSELSQEIKVVKGLSEKWGMCSRTAQLDGHPWSLSCWKNTIAVGSTNKVILILDTITGSQIAILSGHTSVVESLAFSSDGVSLVSGGYDTTVKLWDVQTGGVVKTFYGHTAWVCSVSISANHTIIASGAEDKTIRLWHIQMGRCYRIIKQQENVSCVRFSPTDPQHLMSASGGIVQKWNTGGHAVGPAYIGHQFAFSSDGTQLMLRGGDDVTIQRIGLVAMKFDMAKSHFNPCCFSPNGKLVAVAVAYNAYVWDIAGSCPHLVETFIGHNSHITSLAFSSPSTLISAAQDKLVKFWQIGISSINSVVTDPKSTPFTPAPTKAKNGPIIPSDLPDGVLKTWGISTGLYRESFQISAEDSYQSNIQLVDNRWIFVWYADEEINIWDTEKGELLHTINIPGGGIKDLRVSGDGSKLFCLYEKFIQAWDIWTREVVGEVGPWDNKMEILSVDGSKIWVHFLPVGMLGWDFGNPGSPPVVLYNNPPVILHLNDTKLWETNTSRMKDTVTGKVVFQLPKSFRKPVYVLWSGQYLLAHLLSGEALILDFSHMFPQ